MYEEFCGCVNQTQLGFAVLDARESTRGIHDLIYARFPTAPQVKIYDNSCHLHKTCMKLDPLYWKNTTFVIDRYHDFSHDSCSPVFKMNHFSYLDRTTFSQTAEQFHAELERSDLTGSLAHMTQVNFLLTCRFNMFLHNVRFRQNPVKAVGSLRFLIEQLQLERLNLSTPN